MQAQQIVIAQKFVGMKGKAGDDMSAAIMDAVVTSQQEISQSGINATAVVRQVVVTGQLQLNLLVIIDIMQIVTIQANPPADNAVAKKPTIIK